MHNLYHMIKHLLTKWPYSLFPIPFLLSPWTRRPPLATFFCNIWWNEWTRWEVTICALYFLLSSRSFYYPSENQELSNLYLKLLKLVYSSVSVFPAENEQMLRVFFWNIDFIPTNNSVSKMNIRRFCWIFLKAQLLLLWYIHGKYLCWSHTCTNLWTIVSKWPSHRPSRTTICFCCAACFEASVAAVTTFSTRNFYPFYLAYWKVRHIDICSEFFLTVRHQNAGLNGLQNPYHAIQVRELIVELCLTVPVRLSSLVPHIPMLMEPLVLALNGSPSLVLQVGGTWFLSSLQGLRLLYWLLQGLRTLELCIDNLQPDFFHEHMGSVRSNLMRALWHIVGQNTNEQAALAAWRTLGKFGGLSRRVLAERQTVGFV